MAMERDEWQDIGRKLVEYYERNARELPWRTNPTPYRVLVSEVMLQQTVVGTVLGYFERWMERWPDPASLSGATEQEVLAFWQGLGYYRRASRLLGAARMIVSEFGGEVPDTRQELRQLPGVGPYIADAVLSFAYGRDVVTVDANVTRVFMRLGNLPGRGTEAAVRRQVREWGRAALPEGESPELNQGVMDFGTAICRPRNPDCGSCFLDDVCQAFRAGRQYDIPEPRERNIKKVDAVIGILRRDGSVYIQKRPPEGLFAKMWEFPGGKIEPGEEPHEAVVREVQEEVGVSVTAGHEVMEAVHHYTVFEVTLHVFPVFTPQNPPEDETHRWVPWDALDAYPMPSVNERIIARLREEWGE
jgi:A/G-specific adenine glycosylase